MSGEPQSGPGLATCNRPGPAERGCWGFVWRTPSRSPCINPRTRVRQGGGPPFGKIHTVTMPRGRAEAPLFFAARGRRTSLHSHEKARGAERRETRRLARPPERPARPPDTLCEACPFRLRSRKGASRRSTAATFGARDRASGRGQGRSPLIQAAFAALRPCPSSHSRQPGVVPADGDPRPPGGGDEPTRGRRSRSVFRIVSS